MPLLEPRLTPAFGKATLDALSPLPSLDGEAATGRDGSNRLSGSCDPGV